MINYAIKTNEQGFTVVQSSVESNNLTHVTEKDVTSFYLKMSQSAFIDTGLLPVDGTGLLAYRQAGNHAQIVVQRSPSVNRIIWGAAERDPDAGEYFVAQPYQIYIGDILDDNFYGARIFYSPNPITSPNDPLYHTNLPNTNCKGYRGNGVGWVCLYHTEIWKDFPIGEKMARLIERCSGSEAYNDQNMSETDGTRFYMEHYNRKNLHLWSPAHWQQKTENEGISWVTHPDTWIPVLVRGIDDQARHDPQGVPLTIGMALTGNYSAYYNDSYLPKPVNAIVRQIDSSNVNVMNLIKKAYVNAPSIALPPQKPQDPYTYAVEVRQSNVNTLSKSKIKNQEEEEEEENSNVICASCGNEIDPEDTYITPNHDVYCCDCFSEHYVILDNGETQSKDDCVWIDSLDLWVHSNDVTYCECETPYVDVNGNEVLRFKHWYLNIMDTTICVDCCTAEDLNFSAEDDPRIVKCSITKVPFPSNPKYGFEHYEVPHFDDSGNLVKSYVSKPYYKKIENWSQVVPCPCGKLESNQKQADLISPATPESLHDMNTHAKIPIAIIDPCLKVNEHLFNDPTKGEISNKFTYGWACAGCCVYNSEKSEYEWDPQSIDYAIYSVDDLQIIHSTNAKNQISE